MTTFRIPAPELLPEPVRDLAAEVAALVERHDAARAERDRLDAALVAAERSRPDEVRRAAGAGEPVPADPMPELRRAALDADTVERATRVEAEAARNRLRDAMAVLPPSAVEVAEAPLLEAVEAYRAALDLVKARRGQLHDALRLRAWLGQAIVPRQVGGRWTTSLGAWKASAPPPSLAAAVRFTADSGQQKELPLSDALAALDADADRLDTLRADEARRLARARADAAAGAFNSRTTATRAAAEVAERIADRAARRAR